MVMLWLCRRVVLHKVGAALLSMVLVACQPIAPPSAATPAPVEANAGDDPAISPIETTETATGAEALSGVSSASDASEAGPTADALPPAYLPELVSVGLGVYRTQYCGVCHVLDAAETRGTFGPTHNHMAATAAQRIADPGYTGAAQTPAEYVTESIVDPQAYIVPIYAMTPHRMPAYTHLSAAEVEALTALLMSQ